MLDPRSLPSCSRRAVNWENHAFFVAFDDIATLITEIVHSLVANAPRLSCYAGS